jgi:hypothetical protein
VDEMNEHYLGWIESKVSMSTLVSFYALVISAFSCIPKASGAGLRGSPSMKVRYSAISLAAGWMYNDDKK